MRYALGLILLIAIPSLGAQTETGKAETAGPCSSAVTGSNHQFSISCQGVSEEQGSQWLAILNKIAKKQLDPKVVMQKLDEMEGPSGSPEPKAAIERTSTVPEPRAATPRPLSIPEPRAAAVTYTYEGVQRTARSGLPATNSKNPAAKAYRKIKRAHANRQWQLLDSLCDQAIDDTPEWLTPVFYKAEAKANLGKLAEAVALLEEVKRRATGNPEYELLLPEVDALMEKIHRAGF
jgi:hypothetical protein